MVEIEKVFLLSLLIMALEEINHRNFRNSFQYQSALFLFTKPATTNSKTNKRFSSNFWRRVSNSAEYENDIAMPRESKLHTV